MKSCIPLLILVFFAFHSKAGSAFNDMRERAALLYSEGKYAEALVIWYDIVNSGNTDPNVFFNIGSAESMLHHLPESILAFEKATRLRPADKLIKEAIKKERAKMDNAVIPVSPFFLIEWYHQLLAILRPGGWVFTGFLFLAFSLWQWLVSIHALRKFELIRRNRNWYFSAAGFLFVLMGLLAFHRIHKKDEAVVMLTCDSRQAASEESPVTRILNPGEKVRITDHIGDWNKVSLLNLDEGWIKKECIQTIVIGTH
ncbi:MAG TPA: SH3 domain-containing protein [Saprospiraceae bacterium]|nr:SH3 domain-containing protein [Saprospiraceae bacterium]